MLLHARHVASRIQNKMLQKLLVERWKYCFTRAEQHQAFAELANSSAIGFIMGTIELVARWKIY